MKGSGMTGARIFPPMKAQIISVQVEPDTGRGVDAHGEIAALIETKERPARVYIPYEVWGEDAVNRVLAACRDRKEFDFSIGI